MSHMGFLLVFQAINKKVSQFAWYHLSVIELSRRMENHKMTYTPVSRLPNRPLT